MRRRATSTHSRPRSTAVSQLALVPGRNVAEAEINPLIVKPAGQGVAAVDGLIAFGDN